MKIGVPKEIKNNECRVGLTPESVGELSLDHEVYVERGAGREIGFTDEMYKSKGAKILSSASDIFLASSPP